MNPTPEPLALLSDVGAVLEGHFQYASGRHGPLYVEKFRLLEDPQATTNLCGQIARHFAEVHCHDHDGRVGVGADSQGFGPNSLRDAFRFALPAGITAKPNRILGRNVHLGHPDINERLFGL